mgnify:CR=1 FL=1
MIGKSAAEIFGKGLSGILEDGASEKSKLASIFKRIASYPLKIFAAYLAAPVLLVRMAWGVENPLRRGIAVLGLLLSWFAALAAGTALGTVAGAAFVATNIGYIAAIGFLVGTTFSVYLTVIFSIIIFNAVSFVFLKLNTQEIVDHLHEIST